jgi:hypothetical protein
LRGDNPVKTLVRIFALTVALVVSAGTVRADEVVAMPDGSAGMDVIVWRSEASWERGMALLKAGQRDLASQHIACIVDRGTRVESLRTGYAYATFRVLVLEGKHSGCEGNVTKLVRRGRAPS